MTTITTETANDIYEKLTRLSRDIRDAAATMTPDEARFLVGLYYDMQGFRINGANKARAASANQEPHRVLSAVLADSETLEANIAGALEQYAKAQPIGRWMLSIFGIGRVISAGLIAHIDISKAPTVGHIWRFAGLDPTIKWLGREGAGSMMREAMDADESGTLSDSEMEEYRAIVGDGDASLSPARVAAVARLTGRSVRAIMAMRDEKGRITRASVTKGLARRPWNADLKVLCYKIGQSFVFRHNNPKCFYGRLYAERKAEEVRRNTSGEYREAAAASLREKNYGAATVARAAYEAGRLPDAHIEARARRWTVKVFLAHLHGEWYRLEFGREPPLPWILAHGGHAHYIAPPAAE